MAPLARFCMEARYWRSGSRLESLQGWELPGGNLGVAGRMSSHDEASPWSLGSVSFVQFVPQGWEMMSGKFGVAARMLEQLRATTSDRIVIVSNYTQVSAFLLSLASLA